MPADGTFRLVGGGWGHGRGMSQWGAYQAATEGASYQSILRFYYPGTTLTALPGQRIRVLLTSDTGRDLVVRARPKFAAAIGGAAARRLPAKPAGCRSAATSWRARATKSGLRLSAYCRSWRTVRTTAARSITFSSGEGLVLTRNGSVRRGYRGTVSAVRTGSRSVQVVNTVALELYLRTVVPAEVSASWPREALRAQAVAARTYALAEARARSGGAFDVYDSTRSQVYRAAIAYSGSWRVVASREHAATNAAIRDTAAVTVTTQGAPVLTQFSSSNGGASASSPLAHMVARADPWDARAIKNSRHTWTDTVTARTLAARYPAVGSVRALEVLSREGAGRWGGRIIELRIVGSRGSRLVVGDTAVRAALGTNSSLLTVQ